MVLVAVTGTTKVARTDRMGPDGCISARYLAPKRTQYQPVPGDIRGAHWTCWSKSPVDTQEMWRFHVKWNHNRFIRNAGGMLNVDPNLHDAFHNMSGLRGQIVSSIFPVDWSDILES